MVFGFTTPIQTPSIMCGGGQAANAPIGERAQLRLRSSPLPRWQFWNERTQRLTLPHLLTGNTQATAAASLQRQRAPDRRTARFRNVLMTRAVNGVSVVHRVDAA